MNKTAIKNFAMWAREQLIQDVSAKAAYFGITDKGYEKAVAVGDVFMLKNNLDKSIALPKKEAAVRESFIKKIESLKVGDDYTTAYQSLVEEIAYTWFNRIIAIRFMEVNGYLPSKVNVLSSDTVGKSEPDIVTHPEDADLGLSDADNDYIYELKINNRQAELFKFLFIKQCNALNGYLPELFEKFDDYTEMFIDLNYADKDSVVRRVVSDIDEQDFSDAVEIIGWMYQFYNTVPKQNVSIALKKNIKIDKDSIPAATQLFTPDWIVRYMIENSLGKKYIDYLKTCKQTAQGGKSQDFDLKIEALKRKWKYFIDSEEFEKIETFDVANITVIDPCMGSGHILVYAFEALMDIYKDLGYAERDIPALILQNNLFGLDIDKRAYQLSYFAVMMMARKYDRAFLKSKKVKELHLSDFVESNGMKNVGEELSKLKTVKFSPTQLEIAEGLTSVFCDAYTFGSAIMVTPADYDGLRGVLETALSIPTDIAWVETKALLDKLIKMCKVAKLLSNKYDVVCTNPPYMGSSGMDGKLSKFVKDNYPDSKSDLCTVFIERGFDFIKVNGYNAMVTMHSWMFLSSFEKLRASIVSIKNITSMAHLGARGFEEIGGEVVQTTAFVMHNSAIKSFGNYFRLVDFTSEQAKREAFLQAINDKDCKYKFKANSANFNKIPGSPIAYWGSAKAFEAYSQKNLELIAQPRHGLATSDNDRFLKLWFEVESNKESLWVQSREYKWFPMNKGGAYRKWYGNMEWVINYESDGKEIKEYAISIYKCSSRTIQNTQFYFKQGLTWSALTSGNFSVRYSPKGSLFGSGGYCAFSENENLFYILALMNNVVTKMYIGFVSPTLNYEVGHIKTIPALIDSDKKDVIDVKVSENIAISKTDWDSFETSWDFTKHPLI